MTLAPNRLIASINHTGPDVSLRVDEWLRGVATGDTPGTGSRSSLSNLSSIHDDWLVQWVPEPGSSDKVQSWLQHGSLAAPPLLPRRQGSNSATGRSQGPPVTPFANERVQGRARRSTASGQFIFPPSTLVHHGRPQPIPSQSGAGVKGLTVRALGKGKGPAFISSTTIANEKASQTIEPGQGAPMCGICQEGFNPSRTPLETAHSPGSSSKSVRYGLYLECPRNHGYCLDCLTGYIRVKLEDKEGHAKFPVRCPECPPRSDWEIDDETAGKVLVKDLLETWHSQRLLASINMFYCPNPKCSEAIEITDDIFPLDRTECPACRSEICYQCRSMWHIGLDCEDAKNPLPDEEAFQRLAAKNHWRNCPRCGVMVERTEGCNHMTCRCGAEFCFACGANYAGGCTRIGGCDGQWLDAGAPRGARPLRTARRIRPGVRFDSPPPPQILLWQPPTPPRPTLPPLPPLPPTNAIRRLETLLVETQRERHQQEIVSGVSRPQRLLRRRPDEEPAVIEAERPRKLHRPRPLAPVPDPADTPALGGHRYAIHRWWATRSPRVQPANQEVSLVGQDSSGTPTDEEWVMLSSRTDNVRQTMIIQPPSPDEVARTPNTGLQRTLAAIDTRMKPLPPVPVIRSAAQQRNTADVGSGLQLVFPSRQRRDSDQSRSGRRGVQSLRLPRLSLPGRVRH